MTEDALRLSQIITSFGPGAMVDLPGYSIIIGGTDGWVLREGSYKTLHEPRLTDRLTADFRNAGRITDDSVLTLRTPPRSESEEAQGDSIPGYVFPEWFVCERDKKFPQEKRRRLVKWNQLSVDGRGKRTFDDDGSKLEVTPIRFVGGCENGHLQDLNWRWILHQDSTCREPMWLEEKNASGAPADTIISCNCKRSISLQSAFAPGRIGQCGGKRPWLRTFERRDPSEACDRQLRFLTRTATNTYFPQVVSVISLPEELDALTQVLARGDVQEAIAAVKDAAEIATARKYNPRLAEALKGFDDDQVFAALQQPRSEAGIAKGHLTPEFDLFASGAAEIGDPSARSNLYAKTLAPEIWRTATNAEKESDLGIVDDIVAVHRLREVSCLYGFTRFEPPPPLIDEGLDEVKLSVEGAPLGIETNWLPAIEQFGEGIFIKLNADRISTWLEQPEVRDRERALRRGFYRWKADHPSYRGEFRGLAYVLTHSLSHALMAEIALYCGYPASSLKERIYALRNAADPDHFDRLGLLIYTASPGAQGTLGGIISICDRFAEICRRALERVAICSNDPVCADHEPGKRNDDRMLLGAACHSCLLVAETSCEAQNQYLDRACLVDTLIHTGMGAFEAK